jgi:excisionase family DNA binding protein
MRSPHHAADQNDRHQSHDIGRKAALFPMLDASNDRLLTVAELAFVVHMHPVSVRRLALAGRIPSLKIGRSVRFKLSDVLESMESRGRSDDE